MQGRSQDSVNGGAQLGAVTWGVYRQNIIVKSVFLAEVLSGTPRAHKSITLDACAYIYHKSAGSVVSFYKHEELAFPGSTSAGGFTPAFAYFVEF